MSYILHANQYQNYALEDCSVRLCKTFQHLHSVAISGFEEFDECPLWITEKHDSCSTLGGLWWVHCLDSLWKRVGNGIKIVDFQPKMCRAGLVEITCCSWLTFRVVFDEFDAGIAGIEMDKVGLCSVDIDTGSEGLPTDGKS